MINIDSLIRDAIERNASDIHITPGLPVIFRIVGDLQPFSDERVEVDDMKELVFKITTQRQRDMLANLEDVDFAYETTGETRIRANIYHQRNNFALALRILKNYVPSMEELGLPEEVLQKLCMRKSGLILVTGPTGSGKSTTLASMIDYINRQKRCHIITLEDPIEYIHNTKKSLVSQRELGTDLLSFAGGLRASLREDPDVILVGEMRDYETIALAITAAETGHLVLSTLHTTSAAQTVDRIIDVFPQGQQNQVRTQLATVLVAVMSQQLTPNIDNTNRCVALEIMIKNDAIANLIRDNSSHQIESTIITQTARGMQIMDLALAKLVNNDKIKYETGFEYSVDKKVYENYVNRKIM
jgi:twitching motility protein PilT